MRDLLEDILKNQPLDPREAARRSVRPQVRKRFYKAASVGEGPEGHAVLLDGKPVRTPARRALAAPTRALGEALAAEWNAQAETIDPARMPLTRLANTIIDGVADKPAEVADEVAKYLGSDLLFYRADGPAGLVARQGQHWDPVLDWARDSLGAHFILAEGVMHVAQPEPAVAAARAALPGDPWVIGAAHVLTTVTGSALLALALIHGVRDPDQVWAAAHVDEDWNVEQWGADEEAMVRRASREVDFRAAVQIVKALAPTG